MYTIHAVGCTPSLWARRDPLFDPYAPLTRSVLLASSNLHRQTKSHMKGNVVTKLLHSHAPSRLRSLSRALHVLTSTVPRVWCCPPLTAGSDRCCKCPTGVRVRALCRFSARTQGLSGGGSARSKTVSVRLSLGDPWHLGDPNFVCAVNSLHFYVGPLFGCGLLGGGLDSLDLPILLGGDNSCGMRPWNMAGARGRSRGMRKGHRCLVLQSRAFDLPTASTRRIVLRTLCVACQSLCRCGIFGVRR